MKRLMTALAIFSLVACSQTAPTEQAPETDQQEEQTTEDDVSQNDVKSDDSNKQAEFNGTYMFDAEKYKQAQLDSNSSVFKNMKEQDVEQMLKIFKPFRIEIEGNTAKASFSHDVIQGTVATLKKTDNETHLHMTPNDDNKKDQAVNLIIRGNELILDPGKTEADRMFFKKVE